MTSTIDCAHATPRPMSFDLAVPVPLDVWKDPQGFVIVRQVRDEAWLYFRCWNDDRALSETVGCLHFLGVWHLETTRFSGWKGYPNVQPNEERSAYLVIEESSLRAKLEAQRSAHDPNWRQYDRRSYRHFVVESHDTWIDLVATDVRFSLLTGEETAPLFALWNEI